jgi:uncharacterized protein
MLRGLGAPATLSCQATMNQPSITKSPPNPAWVLCGYLVAVFVGGALLAPWIWTFAQHLSPNSSLAAQPFRRYVDRSLLGVALLGLWPMARSGLFPGWQSVGLVWGRPARRYLLMGLAGGMVSLAVVALLSLGFGVRTWDSGHSWSLLLSHAIRALGAAIAVSFMEELLFRGIVFGSLRRRFSFAPAALSSAALYALVHFFRRPEAPDSVGPWTGLEMLAQMLSGLGQPAQVFPGILTLGAIGWLLAWCRERTGALWLPLGLHAGWIFWFKSYTFFTTTVASKGTPSWWWGSARLHDGWLTFAVIAVTTAFFVGALGGRRNPATASPLGNDA